MKVKILKTFVMDASFYRKSIEVELESSVAKNLIKNGLAQEVKIEKQKVAKPKGKATKKEVE